MKLRLFSMILLVPFLCRAVAAEELRIAAAADLKFALDVLVTQYEKQTGKKIQVSYGSSGNFFAQIQNGAPFDIFMSADIDYPRKLEATGLADAGSLYKYAVGQIVIWTPADAPLDIAKLGWNALLQQSVAKIAIANPEHAPYGRAAIAALRSAGIYDQVRTKLVYGENIAQAAQFVASGNAQAGILALSLALSLPMRSGKRWEVPPNSYPPIEQAAIILKTAKHKAEAQGFLTFLKSSAAAKILDSSGFSPPAISDRRARTQ